MSQPAARPTTPAETWRVLRAGNADVDVVSGATSSSEIWLESLRRAIREARRAG